MYFQDTERTSQTKEQRVLLKINGLGKVGVTTSWSDIQKGYSWIPPPLKPDFLRTAQPG